MKVACALLVLLVSSALMVAADTTGVVSLDSRTFDKIADGHRPLLVRVDKKWSTSTVFKELSEKVHNSDTRLLLGEINVVEYGEKENQELADRFNVKKEDYPTFLFFPEGNPTGWKKYDGSTGSVEDFIRWLKKTGISMGLAGTLPRFDELAAEFVKNEVTRTGVLEEAEKVAAEEIAKLNLESHDGKEQKATIDTYLRVMKNVIKEGTEFVDKEVKRIEKLIADKSVKKDKKDMFNRRLNVVSSFAPNK